jgi:glucosamine--fructose-6-phosphate aminotransferase (isomerizing)
MNTTEKVIFEQFPYWEKAIGANTSDRYAKSCSSSSAAAPPTILHCRWPPTRTWPDARQSLCPARSGRTARRASGPTGENTHVVALSRSGETTETVAAAKASRAAGAFVTAITVEPDSSLAKNCDRMIAAADPSGRRDRHDRIGKPHGPSRFADDRAAGSRLGREAPPASSRSALDAALPANYRWTVAFRLSRWRPALRRRLGRRAEAHGNEPDHDPGLSPLEYRHGPISLVDGRRQRSCSTARTRGMRRAKLVGELREKGAVVIGLGGPGRSGACGRCRSVVAGLVVLPALQILGERAAQVAGIDTVLRVT